MLRTTYHRNTPIDHFRVALSRCFTTEAECETSDMKRIFSHANKSHFHNKGFIFSLVLKVEIFWKSEMALLCVRKTQTRAPGWGLSFFLKNAALGLGFG